MCTRARLSGGAALANACAVATGITMHRRAVCWRHAEGTELAIRAFAASQARRVGTRAFDAIGRVDAVALELAIGA